MEGIDWRVFLGELPIQMMSCLDEDVEMRLKNGIVNPTRITISTTIFPMSVGSEECQISTLVLPGGRSQVDRIK